MFKSKTLQYLSLFILVPEGIKCTGILPMYDTSAYILFRTLESLTYSRSSEMSSLDLA